jgi:hypothetical protein
VVVSRPGRFTPDTHWIKGSVGPRAGLDNAEKILLPLPEMEHRLSFASKIPGTHLSEHQSTQGAIVRLEGLAQIKSHDVGNRTRDIRVPLLEFLSDT